MGIVHWWERMNIFIGWSGDISKLIAKELRSLTHKVLQKINSPFVSDIDISKGDEWYKEITKKLKETNFGIFCFTPENIGSVWMHFEAGAIHNHPNKTFVCPLLFELKIDDIIKGPLYPLQTTKFNKDDLLKLFFDINKKCTPSKRIDEKTLTENFNNHWIEFDKLNKKAKQLLEKKIIEDKEVFSTNKSYEILLSDVSGKVDGIDTFLQNAEFKLSKSQMEELRNQLYPQISKSALKHLLSCWQDLSECVNNDKTEVGEVRSHLTKIQTPIFHIFKNNEITDYNIIKEKKTDVSSMKLNNKRD